MTTLNTIEAQLTQLGLKLHFWNRPEVRELAQILVPGEQIKACISGRYEGGVALFTATDQRLLLIDKKLFHLTVEDIRYDMITEVDYGAQLFTASLRVCTPGKNLLFNSFKPKALRAMGMYLQNRVMEIRQHHYAVQAQYQMAPMQQTYQQQSYASTPAASFQPTGEQAVTDQSNAVPSLPMPQFRNPYTNIPLLMRRRIGRFATGAPLLEQP